jgi:hypothetical protein
MHIAVTGALTGLGVAVIVLVGDFVTVRRNAAERAKRWNKPMALDPTERKGLASLARLCLLLPPAFALVFWLLGS